MAVVLLVQAAWPAAETGNLSAAVEPPFPTKIFAHVDGKKHPLRGVKGKRPFIIVDSKTIKLPKEAAFSIERANDFAPGHIQFHERGAVNTHTTTRTSDGVQVGGLGSYSTSLDFVMEFTAGDNYENCYAAFVLFSRRIRDQQGDPTIRLLFEKLPDLKRGRRINFSFSLSELSGLERTIGDGFPVLYSNGREIRTQHSSESAAYFRKLSQLRHKRTVQRYVTRFANEDRDAARYLMFPAFKTGDAVYPASVTADITIEADGMVKDAIVRGDYASQVEEDAIEALQDWWFMPQISAGSPIPAKAAVEVSFSD